MSKRGQTGGRDSGGSALVGLQEAVSGLEPFDYLNVLRAERFAGATLDTLVSLVFGVEEVAVSIA
jgi:hypothetical protein